MSNVQIPNLPVATGLSGSEQFESVQNGTSVRVSASQIAAYISAAYPAPGIASVSGSTPISASTVGNASTISLNLQGITNAYMATMPARTIKANITAGSAPPTDATISQVLDNIGSSGGSLLYRGSTSWLALSAGSSGQIFTSGGTGAPSWQTLSSALDSTFSGSHGSILYRGATGWQSLPPDVAGRVLATGGPSANPYWIPVGGTGTVTSVASGTGLTGGPISTTGTISIANTGVTPGSYGSSSSVPVFNVNSQGQIISASNNSINAVTLSTGSISSAPINGNDITNKAYVDTISAGINFHQSVAYATTSALPTYSYNNGTGGVNAQITATANGALVIDGYTFVVGDIGRRVLIKNEISANAPFNGVYTITQPGSASSVFVLTRTADYNTSGTGVNQINGGDFFLVTNGTANTNTSWVQQTQLPITIGTTALFFTQFAAPVLYSAGTGLNLAGTVFNISNTSVVASNYGSASSVPTITVNAQGQITSASNTSIAINANQINAGTLPVARGGTGLTNYAVGDLVFASGATTLAGLAGVATGNALISGGVGVSPSYGKIGLTTHVSGTLPTANGGTNLTATPINGQLLIGNGTGYSLATLTNGTNISVANGSGTITINTSATPTWTSETVPLISGGTTASSTLTLQSTSGAGTSDAIIFRTASQSERMRITTAGDVGIGTSTPSYKLDVLATGNISGQFKTSGSINALYLADAGTTAGTLYIGTVGNDFRVVTGSNERMRIDSSGNVGIKVVPNANTTSGLFVAGDITRVGGTGSYLFNLQYSTANARWEYAGTGTGAGWVDTGSGNYVFLSTGSTSGTANAAASVSERMRISAAGGFSVGTTSDPGVGLISDVSGNVRSIPQNAQTTGYTLVVGDNGKHISITTGGVTVPASVFAIGDNIVIFNNSGSSQTITQGASVTLRLAGTATTGNRTLAQYGVATILCVASNTFVISGSGLT